MNKIVKKLLIVFIISVALYIFNGNKAKAASADIPENLTVVKGQTVTVTATVNAGGWNLLLEGEGKTQHLVGNTTVAGNQTVTTSISFEANQNTVVTLTGDITDFSEDVSQKVSRTCNITVQTASTGENNPSNGETQNNGGTTTNNSNNTVTKSSNANLSNLGITPNDFTGFTPSKTSYTVSVPNNVSSIQIYANKAQSGQTISGTGAKNLNEGANSFNIIVTAEDGTTTKTYTLTVNREPAENTEENEEEQNNETAGTTTTENEEEVFGLSELKIDGIELSPKFSSDVYEYTAKLISENDKVDIVTKATDEGAKVEITGNENLKEGENIITILVSDEAGDKSTAYQIKLTKSLVDEEALAREKELQDQERTRNTIIICCAVAVLLVIIIILIWRHRRNKRLAEEYSIPYQGFNDDDYDNYGGSEFNQGNVYEKISDKFDSNYNDIQPDNQLTSDTNKLGNNNYENDNNLENTENKYEDKKIYNDSNEWYNKDLSKNIDETDSILEDKDELRRQYLNQSFDNDIDFDSKPKKRHSKGKRFK